MTESSQNQYLAVPDSGRGAGLLALHAWWGLNDFMRAFCDRLAQDGFVALAPDLYHGKTARTVEEAQQLRSNVNWKQAAAEIAAAVEALRRQPSVIGTGIGVVGFSIGANWALWLAEESPELIQAVALFYGTRGAVTRSLGQPTRAILLRQIPMSRSRA